MPWQRSDLAPGLHLVATPIGNARDITLRALDTLASAEVLAAEDTRSLRRLMDIHGIALAGRPLVAYHDHNGERVRPRLIADLRAGRSVAYTSDAGTPLVADPGFALARAAIAAGCAVHAVPGPSAVLAALAVAGLPTDRFLFAGFLPPSAAARRAAIGELANVAATLVLCESPRRIRELFADLAQALGTARQAAVCRELTKRFETVMRGTLGELSAQLDRETPRGEFVIVIDRGAEPTSSDAEVEAALTAALSQLPLREAADTVSTALRRPRREVYRIALRLSGRSQGEEEGR
jgi:16S rRNA (cytidine1402-2'-O)-methyltransferase